MRLVASSDAGAIPNLLHLRLAGVVLLGRCAGMSHAEAFRSATSEAVAALEFETECGALLEGLSTDLMVVCGDPDRRRTRGRALWGPAARSCQAVRRCRGSRGSAKRPSWALCAGSGLGASGLCVQPTVIARAHRHRDNDVWATWW